MKDYEAKFWLPFKGIDKPVYAIPGNHDWYDALEGFNATFLTSTAARAAMHARVEADLHLTSTTDKRIDELITQGRLAAQGIWRADRAPGGPILPDPDGALRLDRRRHGRGEARGP